MEKPTEEQIRQRAHELWEQNHRPDGRDDEFWHQNSTRELRRSRNRKRSSNDFVSLSLFELLAVRRSDALVIVFGLFILFPGN
jgi:hypothetical protein